VSNFKEHYKGEPASILEVLDQWVTNWSNFLSSAETLGDLKKRVKDQAEGLIESE